LYQEQVMQIAQVLAKYTLGGADLLRRAMGKKKPEEMAKQRAIFLAGAEENHVDKKQAAHIFDLMEKFAGYGFNKSHSAAYALLAYQTAWLKAHYPAAFMAAVLSADMDNTDKVVGLILECQHMGLTVLYADINQCEYQFTVRDDATILFGLGAIKGVGQGAIESIIHQRTQQGAYRDLFDFCQRVDLQKVNRRTLEALIRAGSMDALGAHRASLLLSIDKAIKVAEQQAKNQQAGQEDLFASQPMANNDTQYVTCPEWSLEQKLQGEKATLGFYISGHPLDRYAEELPHLTTCGIAELDLYSNKTVTIAGLVVGLRTLFTKRGNRMAILTLEAGAERCDVTVFSEAYQRYQAALVKDEILIVEGEVSLDEFTGNQRLTAERILRMDDAREAFAKCLKIHITEQQANPQFIAELKNILHAFTPGGLPVVLQYAHAQASSEILLGKQWQVKPQAQLFAQLTQCCDPAQFSVEY
jgi:DNA polymerase-3 subunit alpha